MQAGPLLELRTEEVPRRLSPSNGLLGHQRLQRDFDGFAVERVRQDEQLPWANSALTWGTLRASCAYVSQGVNPGCSSRTRSARSRAAGRLRPRTEVERTRPGAEPRAHPSGPSALGRTASVGAVRRRARWRPRPPTRAERTGPSRAAPARRCCTTEAAASRRTATERQCWGYVCDSSRCGTPAGVSVSMKPRYVVHESHRPAGPAGTKPGPWVTWQETTTAPVGGIDQIFVERPIGPGSTTCDGVTPAGVPVGGHVPAIGGPCWQQAGVPRVGPSVGDPSLNVDPTRDGVEPDIAFTGRNAASVQDGVPWVVWYEKDGTNHAISGCGLCCSGIPPGRRSPPTPRRPGRQADRRPSRALAGDGQGVLLRSDGGEGAGGQGPLSGGVPWLRRVHPAAQRQRRCLCVLQGLPPRRDRAALDPRTGTRRDARLARPLRAAADVDHVGVRD